MDFNATLIGEMISFAILIWFCVHFIWPYLNKAIEERQLKIAEGLNAAERAHADLKAADSKVQAEIKQARLQASEIIDKAQQQANQIIEKARGEAVSEINRLKASAQDDIASMAQRARDELREQVGALAVAGASRIVQREVDASTHKALLDQLAAEI
ncbi:MAG: F0F1 ATP synthase subunit B [Rhodanobacter sp.]|jgi:F-type H+-transporting ATPase subunit b|uniref:ATP synthase subunit b n=2 Tax=unclassified Rhodanobacter TaxID=2621553 RepID=A0AB74UPT7_9GAMM|nr:F0F1 ATP synthase subunit B [Rhodanobacter sp.]MBN8948615.1 F0F1 ATP synthase subunit B [Rhodanobacter sp.]ODT96576.1 MAG: F0F1 ATP synthase subunit B [Rhodanobacter sp. SCN 67-45]OJW35363.1 MAG: F0F1 ATP synthase subunit B [Rhodanobacter sp. 67-28]